MLETISKNGRAARYEWRGVEVRIRGVWEAARITDLILDGRAADTELATAKTLVKREEDRRREENEKL